LPAVNGPPVDVMGKVYYRPLGLTHGEAALRSIARGAAGRLAGHRAMAFHAVEIIERTGTDVLRDIVPFGDLPQSDMLARLQMPRSLGLRLTLAEGVAVMGIVNVTPDSFSDGGRTAKSETAIASGLAMAGQGAAILDVGGESTRPGSEAVPEEEELRRVLPVIAALAGQGHVVSCDTRKARVMREAAAAGAALLNDVSALRHESDAAVAVAETGLPVVLMHAQGDPRTMQLNPVYDDVALDVYDHLEERVAAARAAGIKEICIDPGIGFGKTFRHNLDILSQLTLYHGLGVPLLVGLSRKAFIGALTGVKLAGERVMGSVGGAVQAALQGAHILRVHDVKATVEALAVAKAAADPASSGL
jgi:dihydropteroate synthase